MSNRPDPNRLHPEARHFVERGDGAIEPATTLTEAAPSATVGRVNDRPHKVGPSTDDRPSDDRPRDERPRDVASLVHELHAGRMDVAELSAAERRLCVEHLTMEGFSAAEIGRLMGVSDRTVRRDRAAIRRRHALAPSLKLGDELLGEFQRHVLAAMQRLMRLSNDTEASPYARLWAQEAAVRSYQRLLDTAHRLGYFPTGARRIKHLYAIDPEDHKRDVEERRLDKERMHEMLKLGY